MSARDPRLDHELPTRKPRPDLPEPGEVTATWARVLSLDRTFFTPTIAITITHPTRRGGESLGFIRVCVGSQLVSKSDPVSTSYRSDRYQGRYRKPPEGGWLHARDLRHAVLRSGTHPRGSGFLWESGYERTAEPVLRGSTISTAWVQLGGFTNFADAQVKSQDVCNSSAGSANANSGNAVSQ